MKARDLQIGAVVGDYDGEMDDLDREYYRSKLDELRRCLPVVRAARVWRKATREGTASELAAAEWRLDEALEALEEVEDA